MSEAPRPLQDWEPQVQQMAARIKQEFVQQRADLLGRPYSPGSQWDKSWIKAAKIVIQHKLSPEDYVRTHIRSSIRPDRVTPLMLHGAKALSRFLEVSRASRSTRQSYFRSQFKMIDQLLRAGKTPQYIVASNHDFSPFLLWLLCKTHGMNEQADRFKEEARIIFRLNPEVEDVFGSEHVEELKQ